ncbi:MAG: hypothetical protein ACSLE2_16625 [Lysobacterales bacterium]
MQLSRFWRAILTSLALVGVGLGVPGVVFAQAVPCASLGFEPSEEGEGILERFFVETDGVGGLGCWMHPHSNGKDAIFTPYSWGRNPNPGKQGLIDDAMTAISESTRYLERLGTVQSELYMLLTDLERSDWRGEARWIEDSRCWMEVTPAAGWGAYGPERRWEYKSVIAHEIAHCFLMENFEGYIESATEDFDAWWDESGAEFLMSRIYPVENSEHRSSIRFDLDGSEFMQKYKAVVLLQHFSHGQGVPETVEFLRDAWTNGGEHSAYAAYLDTSGLDTFFHDFNARHFASTVLDPGGGNMPRETDIDSILSQRLESESGVIDVRRIEPRRLVLVDLVLPQGHTLDIQAPADVNDAFHASVYAHGQNRDDWAGGLKIDAPCDIDGTFSLLLTTLRTKGVDARQFDYRTTPIADCDCTNNAQLDACLVGNWEMDPPSRGMMFGEDGPVGGRVGLTYGPSGGFVYHFSNLTFHGVSYTKSGKRKMEILKTYEGTVRGCATTAPQGQRLDGAIPMMTNVVDDGVRRGTMITHGGVGTTTAKTEHGLEKWFWPHKPTYYRCEGDTLHLESRVFQRAPD